MQAAGKWIYAKLSADATVTGYVGAPPDTRVRKRRASQRDEVNDQAYIVYSRISTDNWLAHDGLIGLKAARHELEINAKDQATAEDIAAAVTNALVKNVTFPNTAGGVVCQACILDDDSDDVDPPIHGDEVGRGKVILDLILWMEE